MSIDRTEKHRIERLAAMVPIASGHCRDGRHDDCPGVRAILTGDSLGLSGDGRRLILDTVEARCGCACHRAA